jgi:hypothetical protein
MAYRKGKEPFTVKQMELRFLFGGRRRGTQVAREIGITYAHLYRIMRLERIPSFRVAMRLADAAGITCERLYDLLGLKDTDPYFRH